MLKSLTDPLLSLAYPQICHVCHESVEEYSGGVACGRCWSATRIFTGTESICAKCGAYFGDKSRGNPEQCENCRDHSYDIARSVGVYEKALSATILQLKKEPHLTARLKQYLVASLAKPEFAKATLVMPIPLSKIRRHDRGFNQAEIVAKVVARVLGMRLDKASLVRTVHTPKHRAAMDKKSRAATVKGAFEVTRPRLVSGESILLVDDVLTSGSTASACAHELKQHGAAWVGVLTLARAV